MGVVGGWGAAGSWQLVILSAGFTSLCSAFLAADPFGRPRLDPQSRCVAMATSVTNLTCATSLFRGCVRRPMTSHSAQTRLSASEDFLKSIHLPNLRAGPLVTQHVPKCIAVQLSNVGGRLFGARTVNDAVSVGWTVSFHSARSWLSRCGLGPVLWRLQPVNWITAAIE